jgi:hypothetical protein
MVYFESFYVPGEVNVMILHPDFSTDVIFENETDFQPGAHAFAFLYECVTWPENLIHWEYV